MLEGMAEYYSADLSEKVVRGMTENALKCKYNGGTLPIGYIIDSEQYFQPDPVTAPFILEAFKLYDEGATMTKIRDTLNHHGVKNTRGQPLTYNSVQHLLSNRRYIGEYTYRDIIVPDGIPALVPQDLFDRVQDKKAKNKKAPARHKAEDDYLLTTKLFCGYCGAYLCGESGTSRTGIVHHYYKCVSVKKKRTEYHKKPVKKQWIEDLVVDATMKMVMDDKAYPEVSMNRHSFKTPDDFFRGTDFRMLNDRLTEDGIVAQLREMKNMPEAVVGLPESSASMTNTTLSSTIRAPSSICSMPTRWITISKRAMRRCGLNSPRNSARPSSPSGSTSRAFGGESLRKGQKMVYGE